VGFLIKGMLKMRKKIEIKSTCTTKTFDAVYYEFIINCKVRNLRLTTIKYSDDMVHKGYKYLTNYKTPIASIGLIG
jgi:hypothetical protein